MGKCGATVEILHCFSFVSEAGSRVIECDVEEEHDVEQVDEDDTK